MFACIDIADFPLVAARRLLPPAPGPAVLVESAARQSRVVAACAQALEAGARPGMPAPMALARCPELQVVVASAAAEALAEQTLLHAALGISPRVERTAPGGFLIDLQGRRRAEVMPAAEAALAALHRQDLPARMGIAATPGLATFATRATDYLLQVDDVDAFLAATPLAAAAPSPALATVLRHWGLRAIGDFARLSRESLAHRFGPEALGLWDACHGRDARPLAPLDLPPGYRQTLELDFAVETLEPLLFILRRFVDSLCMQLEARLCVAEAIHLHLRLDDRSDYTFECRLPEPTLDPGTLFRTLQAHLEQAHTAAPVVALALELPAARAQVRQRGLFDTTLKDPARFADTLDRLCGIVGGDRVGTPRLEDTHLPDAVRMERLPQGVPPATPVEAHLRARGLPLRRCRPPLPAEVRLDADGAPAHVHCMRMRGAVCARAGPYRTSGHWWEQPHAWQREEWDVELRSGLLRLSHNGTQWLVEGRYG